MKHSRYEILINNEVWSFYPKSRDGLLNAIDELELAMGESVATGHQDSETFRLVYSVYDADKGAIVDPAHPALVDERYSRLRKSASHSQPARDSRPCGG